MISWLQVSVVSWHFQIHWNELSWKTTLGLQFELIRLNSADFFFFSKCSCFLCKCSCFLCKLVLFKVLALHVFVVVFLCIYLHHLKFQFGFLIAVQKRSPRGVAVSQSYRPFSPAAIWHTSCCRWEPGSAAVSHAQFPVRNFKLYFELQFKSKSLCQEFSNTPFGVEYWTNSQSPNS